MVAPGDPPIEYTAADIEVLEGLEGIRRRAGMFVGDLTDGTGMHWLLRDALDWFLGEPSSTQLRITIVDATIAIDDDGVRDPRSFEIALAHLHGSRTHLPVVAGLSSELIAELARDGRRYVQRYTEGRSLGAIEDVGPTTRRGTAITFTPDFTIFTPMPWDHTLIARRGREIAAFHPGLTVTIDGDSACYRDGALGLVAELAGPSLDPFHRRVDRDGIAIEVAIAWTDRDETELRSFVNHEPTLAGVHVDGLFAGLAAALAPRVTGDVRDRLARGMVAIVHVQVPDPRFDTLARDRLVNPEVQEPVRATVAEAFAAHLVEVPALLDMLLLQLET
jgi:DNA gyrase subunit B